MKKLKLYKQVSFDGFNATDPDNGPKWKPPGLSETKYNPNVSGPTNNCDIEPIECIKKMLNENITHYD